MTTMGRSIYRLMMEGGRGEGASLFRKREHWRGERQATLCNASPGDRRLMGTTPFWRYRHPPSPQLKLVIRGKARRGVHWRTGKKWAQQRGKRQSTHSVTRIQLTRIHVPPPHHYLTHNFKQNELITFVPQFTLSVSASAIQQLLTC